ncbi:MAG: Uma2 family endonuclease [Nakamurella sp.]
MTISMPVPDHLLTTLEWSALAHEPFLHYELAEGVLVMTPRSSPRHQDVSVQIAQLLKSQLGTGWAALVDVEIGLRTGERATHRAPDVTVVRREVLTANRPWMVPADALLVVEVVSPGSGNIDRVLKVHEYQCAGIPAYLVVDLEGHELIGFQLDARGTYVNSFDDPARLTVAGVEVRVGWADLDLD